MTEVLVHLDGNTETLVPDPQVAIETGVPEVTVEMVEVVEAIEAEIGFLLHGIDVPTCRLLIKEWEVVVNGKLYNYALTKLFNWTLII